MDLFTAMDISASGLRAQRTMMNVISSNIANGRTTRTEDGGPYQRRDVILRERSFEEHLQRRRGGDHHRSHARRADL